MVRIANEELSIIEFEIAANIRSVIKFTNDGKNEENACVLRAQKIQKILQSKRVKLRQDIEPLIQKNNKDKTHTKELEIIAKHALSDVVDLENIADDLEDEAKKLEDIYIESGNFHNSKGGRKTKKKYRNSKGGRKTKNHSKTCKK